MKTPRRILSLTLLLPLACASHPETPPPAADAGAPTADAGPTHVDAGPPQADAGPHRGVEPVSQPSTFAFQSGTDAVSVALTSRLAAYTTAPTDGASARALEAQGSAARAALQQNGAAAAAQLTQALAHASPEQASSLYFLLAETDAPEAMAVLRGVALQALPPAPATPTPSEFQPQDPLRLLQHAAVTQLGRAASHGQPDAHAALVDVAAGATVDLAIHAVSLVYASAPRRFLAKRELADRMPSERLYLLNSTY